MHPFPTRTGWLAAVALLGAVPLMAAPRKGAVPGEEPDPMAEVHGEAIGRDEVDRAAATGLFRARQQAYEARRSALDGLVEQRLLEVEATRRGVDVAGLVGAEVDDKAEEIPDATVDAFIEAFVEVIDEELALAAR